MPDRFFRTAFRTRFYESVEQLQEDLNTWLTAYNHERPHQGYRNMGRRQIDTLNHFLQESGQSTQPKPATVRYDPYEYS